MELVQNNTSNISPPPRFCLPTTSTTSYKLRQTPLRPTRRFPERSCFVEGVFTLKTNTTLPKDAVGGGDTGLVLRFPEGSTAAARVGDVTREEQKSRRDSDQSSSSAVIR